MAEANSQASGDQEREQDGAPDPEGKRLLSGECHDPVTGLLYAFTFFLPTAAADDPASFENRLHGVFVASGLECGVSLRTTSMPGDWAGPERP